MLNELIRSIEASLLELPLAQTAFLLRTVDHIPIVPKTWASETQCA